MLKGVYSVLPTPFTPGDQIDPESLRRVIDLFMAAGVDGLTALGVTSETARLTGAERQLVLETVLERVGGRIPVVVGATAEGTATAIELSRTARDAGASALLISPPRMPKLNSDAILRHFSALAAAVDLPIVVQDFPPISGYTLEPALLARIAREIPSARCIKLEDPPTPYKISRIREQAGEIDVAILGGLGGVYLLEELLSGAAGAMTGFAYPEILVGIVRRFQAGQTQEAAEEFYRHVPLMRFEFQEGIGMAIRKEILHRRGAVAFPGVRSPGVGLDASTGATLDRILSWADLRPEGGRRPG